jgi:uncharacterized phage protein (TIGR01671 family)
MSKRKIKFRGKRKDNREWIYGDLTHLSYGTITIQYNIIVNSKTVGQYTGFDAAESNRYITVNGKKEKDLRIFEGDIIHILSNMDEEGVFEVIFAYGGWYLDSGDGDDPIELYIQADHLKEYRIIKIIGNVHDTPELLAQREITSVKRGAP